MSKKLIYLISLVLILALAGTNVVFGDVTFERRISTGSDDGEEAVNTGFQDSYNTSSDLELIDDNVDNGGRQFIGMNFRNIAVPSGANIDSAYIEFVCEDLKDGTADAYLLLWGHLAPNPNGFETPFVISNRPRTEAKVPWEPEPWTTLGSGESYGGHLQYYPGDNRPERLGIRQRDRDNRERRYEQAGVHWQSLCPLLQWRRGECAAAACRCCI